MQILETVRQRFIPVLKKYVDDPQQHLARIAATRDAEHGDYQANLAMPLARPLGRDPLELANEMLAALDVADLCEKVSTAGKGFINLRLSDKWLTNELEKRISDPRLGIEPTRSPRTFVIDFSSPNVAKPMHVGHVRSTVIGDAIARTLRFLGHRVVTDNHIGDWGTQFGMIIYGYKNFVDQSAFEKAPVAELSRLYRLVQQVISYQSALKELPKAKAALKAASDKLNSDRTAAAAAPADKNLKKAITNSEKNVASNADKLASAERTIADFESDATTRAIHQAHAEIESSCLRETALLHSSDPTNLGLWNQFMPVCLDEIHRVYERLDIRFDHELGESFYHDRLGAVVDRLVTNKLAQESDGAICVFLENFEAPMIIQKKDGAFLYATSDLATVDYRLEQFDPDAILYVVDHRQSDHFAKLFATCRAIGIKDVELNHLSFGTVLGKDGKPFKTRSGSVVGLDALLDEAVERAYQAVCNPNRLTAAALDLSEEEKTTISQRVGLGAIKYADLSHNRTSDYVFDLEKMVQLVGETSAYIQYSYARTRNILRKANVEPRSASFAGVTIQLSEPIERQLVLHLLRFEEFLQLSMEDYTPNIIANYLFELAKLFASFYDACHVNAAGDVKLGQSRQALTFFVGQTLVLGLSLLGIEVVERM